MIPEDVLSSMDMIRDSARGIAGADLSRIRKLRYSSPGFDRATWSEMCALGWPALRIPEDQGGVGLGVLPYTALAEEAGRALLPEPLIPAVLASTLLDGEALEAQIEGATLVIPAWQDARGSIAPGTLQIRDGKVTATRLYVPTGADAWLVVGATQSALVAAGAPGVTLTPAATQDGGELATIRFENAPCTVIEADPGPALAEAALATAAYLLGLMEDALDMTVAYLKQRVQFGKTISQFQILQHMAVDARQEIEVTRASIEQAALQWDVEGPTPAAHAAISRAKARASSAAMKVTRDCVQLHGGIGFTDEHDIGLFLRKAMVMAPAFGGARQHRANFARLKPVTEEA
ncbi:MAG: acyl-CoA dehydrogenase [Paracoccus sp. BP8]|uniref:acyl-CoA dehydrogenase family protein n=1 Tax=Paracoccus sp. J39 TaxID=935848 RepID=UPI00048A4819|nr:acyl-CoA dehydrogenase family protein [Paracoccus sp. J39]RQP04107.1 MAG: acyl-CoA dehydrogenase [Paracoccus sp. BP8]